MTGSVISEAPGHLPGAQRLCQDLLKGMWNGPQMRFQSLWLEWRRWGGGGAGALSNVVRWKREKGGNEVLAWKGQDGVVLPALGWQSSAGFRLPCCSLSH